MSDLISRDDAIRIAEQGQIKGYPWQFQKLVTLPSAQLEIIRCKDCINNAKNIGGKNTDNWCYKMGFDCYDNDFCSYGER